MIACVPVLFAAAALAACSAAPQPGASAVQSQRQCFPASSVSGFTAVDRDTVRVTTSPSAIYEIEIIGTCPDVDWSQQIAIQSRLGGSRWVCGNQDADLVVPSALGVDRCPITSVRRLSPGEVEALRRR